MPENFQPRSLANRISKRIQKTFGLDSPAKMWGRVFNLRKKQFVQMDGFGLYAMPTDYIGYSVLLSRSYEPHVTKIIKDNLKPDDVFLDLGANLGYFTMLAASIVQKGSGKVIAFEPNPQNQQLIFSSIEHNKFSNVTVYPLAVSDQKSILKFTTVGSNGGVVTPNSKKQDFYLYVQAVRVDDVLLHEERINLIKMDIEAHEPYALKGMEKTIKKHKPIIITEFHPWAMELNNLQPPVEYLKQLRDFGYSLSIIEPLTGNLTKNLSVDDVMHAWKQQADESVQIDLLATCI